MLPTTTENNDMDTPIPSEPGAYPDLPFEVYVQIDAVNSSWLKAALSALHALHYKRSQDNDTASRGMLRSAHCLMFEPHNFLRDFCWYGGKRDKRQKVYKAHLAENEGRTTLNTAEINDAVGMASAAWQSDVTGPVLAADGAMTELTVIWRDKATGLLCKGRFDHVVVTDDLVTITDGKGVGSSDTDAVGRQAHKLNWLMQAAHYVAAACAVWPGREVRFQLLGVETKDPHDCGIYMLDDLMLGAGETFRRKRLSLLASSLSTNEWPGRYSAPVYLGYPDYGLPTIDTEDDIDFDTETDHG